MKNIIVSILCLGGVLLISNCTTVEQPEPVTHTSSTVTEQTTITRPLSRTVETQTTRQY